MTVEEPEPGVPPVEPSDIDDPYGSTYLSPRMRLGPKAAYAAGGELRVEQGLSDALEAFGAALAAAALDAALDSSSGQRQTPEQPSAAESNEARDAGDNRVSADADRQVGRAVSSVDRAVSQRRRDLEHEALSLARGTAEKWGATTALLFTALGFASIIQGRKQIDTLAPAYEKWAGWALVTGFALALFSIVAAALAAQGASPARALKLPKKRMLDYEREQVKRSGRLMTGSRILAGLAISTVLFGIGCVLVAPLGPSGELECGKTITTQKRQARGTVTTVTTVTQCARSADDATTAP
jgi:hypothetical protein